MNTLELNSMVGYTAPEINVVELVPESAILQASLRLEDYDPIDHEW